MLNKILMAIQLTESMRAGDIVSKFRRRPSPSEGPSNIGNLSKSQTSDSYKNCLNPHNNNKFASDNYYLYEVGGNIGENIWKFFVKLRKTEKNAVLPRFSTNWLSNREAVVSKEWITIFSENSLNFSRFVFFFVTCATRGDSWNSCYFVTELISFLLFRGHSSVVYSKDPRKILMIRAFDRASQPAVIGSQD